MNSVSGLSNDVYESFRGVNEGGYFDNKASTIIQTATVCDEKKCYKHLCYEQK